jgi:hypothetical protein
MNDDDEITLELPEDDVPEVKEEAEPAYITDLKAQLAAEKAGRQAAEQKLHQAAREVHRARSDVDDTNLQLVVNAIDTVSRDIEMLKQAHTFALQSGDFARATEIQSEMSANSAKLLQLENGRDAMQSAPRQPEPAAPPADPVEAFASQLSRRSADWVRNHPEFVRDPRLNAKMIAAHNLAVADGIPTDTDEYFEAIENTLKVAPKAAPKTDTDDQYAAKVVQRRDAAPAAAPANRGGQTGNSNVVRLTREQREMAVMLRDGKETEKEAIERYAKDLVNLKKEGKIQ